MGAASKGIIQRGYQHNATVYKAPYAKNPFDSVTDDEIKEYKRTVERKRAGDCKFYKIYERTNIWYNSRFYFFTDTDTDFSESEAFSSLQISGQVKSPPMSPPSQTESGMLFSLIYVFQKIYFIFFYAWRTRCHENRNETSANSKSTRGRSQWW